MNTVAHRIALMTVAATIAGCGYEPPPGSTAGRMAAAKTDVVDSVVSPRAMQSLGTWVRLVQQAGLVDYLSGPGPFTVFAPVDEAFAALPPRQLEDLLSPGHQNQVRALVLAHVHPGEALVRADLLRRMMLSTADDDHKLTVTVHDGLIDINGAGLRRADVICHNGVVHWVDRVLVP